MANNLQINVNVGGNALSQLQAVEQRIKKTDTAVKTATGGFNKFGTSAANTTRSVRKFSSAGVQQAGFQVGDFFVQVQNGTSALTAFGQQGSQLAGIFGAQGAVIGAVIAIVSALGTAYMKSRDVAKGLADEVEALDDNLGNLANVTKTSEDAFRFLRKEYHSTSEEVVKLFELQKRAAEFDVANSIRKTTDALNSEFRQLVQLNSQLELAEGLSKEIIPLGETLLPISDRGLLARIEKINEEFGITKEQGQILVDQFAILNSTNAFEQPLKAANALAVITKILSTDFASLTKSQFETIQSMIGFEIQLRKTAKVTGELRNEMGLTEEESSKLADGVAGSFGESFTSIVKGTQSVKEAFKNMAMSIIDQLFQVLVVQRMVGAISTGLQTNFPSLFGAPAPQRAIGGSVQRGRPVIVGERGAELFVPSSSGSIVANKNMQGGGVTVNQTINVTTGVQQTVRTEIANLMPQIAEATKSAVADARLRGGSYSKAFGR